MTRVVGLDVSLTSTGVAIIDTNAEKWIKLARVTSAGIKDADLAHRRHRLALLADQIIGCCHGADLVVIEQPAYSRTIGSMHDRSGLWWSIVSHLSGTTRVAEVSPTARAKYATGRGNAGKDMVLAAVIRRYYDAPVSGNDEADALVLAAMGLHHLGEPLPRTVLPKLNAAALDSVRWPA